MFSLERVRNPDFHRLLALGAAGFAQLRPGAGLDREDWIVMLAVVSFATPGQTTVKVDDDALVVRVSEINEALQRRQRAA